jgi:hypothetical protein
VTPDGTGSHYAYNAINQLETFTDDSTGKAVSIKFDRKTRHLSLTNKMDQKTELTLNDMGQPSTIKDASGN